MPSKLLPAMALAILGQVFALAADTPARIRRADISKRSFVSGQLEITLTRFWGGSLLSHGYVEVRVENRSDSAVIFDPNLLSLVNKDKKQVNIRGWSPSGVNNHSDRMLDPARAHSVPPGAFVKEFYVLTGRVRFPALLYYGGQELALIVD